MRIVALMTLLSALTGTVRAADVKLPEPSGGVINGKVAMMTWPMLPDQTLLSPQGCTAHLSPFDHQDEELTYPCAVWFQPPRGRYFLWLEQGTRISHQAMMYWSDVTFKDHGMIVSKWMFPAGWIRFDNAPGANAVTARFLSVNTVGDLRPFDRQLPIRQATQKTAVPVGRVIAGYFDEEGSALALSRAVTVDEGATVTVMPTVAANTGGVLAVFTRRAAGKAPCIATVVGNGKDQRPTDEVQSLNRVVFVWHDLPSGDATLSVACGQQHVTRQITLRKGNIVTVREQLK